MAVTMQDIADLAGVSRPVVSAVLNGSKLKVAPATRARILELVNKTGYVRSLSARILNGKSIRSVALFVNPDYILIYRELQYQICMYLAAYGYRVLNFPIVTPKTESEILQDSLQFGVDGILSIDCLNMIRHEDIKIPLVTLTHGPPYSEVGVDHEYGGYEITRHLLQEHGHRKVCFIGTGLTWQPSKIAGFRRACDEYNIGPEDSPLLDLTWNAGFAQELEHLIRKQGVTAFAASCDYVAVRLIGYLDGLGIKVPGEVAVTGYDGDMYANSGLCRVTTMCQPMGELARVSVEIMMDKINRQLYRPMEEAVILKPALHLSSSCGCQAPREKTICWERYITTLENANNLIKIPPPELIERYQNFSNHKIHHPQGDDK